MSQTKNLDFYFCTFVKPSSTTFLECCHRYSVSQMLSYKHENITNSVEVGAGAELGKTKIVFGLIEIFLMSLS